MCFTEPGLDVIFSGCPAVRVPMSVWRLTEQVPPPQTDGCDSQTSAIIVHIARICSSRFAALGLAVSLTVSLSL